MISVIICTIDRLRFDAVSRHFVQLFANEPHEIIGVFNPPSICEGYNRAFAQSKGDIIIFCHDDIESWAPDLVSRLKNLLSHFDVVGVAGTTRVLSASWVLAGPPFTFGIVPHAAADNRFDVYLFGAPRRIVSGIQAVDGLFIACRRQVAQQISWDAATFSGFHCYDVDWSFRAFQAGFKLAVAVDLPILHLSRGNFDDRWQHYAQAFLNKHGPALAKIPPRASQTAIINVGTKAEALEITQTYCAFFDQPSL